MTIRLPFNYRLYIRLESTKQAYWNFDLSFEKVIYSNNPIFSHSFYSLISFHKKSLRIILRKLKTKNI